MKNFYPKILVFLCLVAGCSIHFKSYSQQRYFFSQYMFNGLTINPAYAGNQKMLSATLMYRKQWVKLDGAPNTQTFTIHNGNKKKKIGYGLMISRDEIGVHRDLNVYGMYAYKIKFRKGTLAMGLQGGFSYLNSNYYLLRTDPDFDPLLPVRTSVLNPNIGTGLFYSTKTLYVGASMPYMINNKILNKKDIAANYSAAEERIYFITAGKVFDLSENTKIKPTTLIRIKEKAPLGFDLNASLIFQDMIALGASYRTGRAFVLLTELTISKHLRLGYSYDYTFSALQQYNRGSHEIMLNWRFDLTPEKCHTYF